MAVVQISKIQVRRGQKNSNSGVPQLSSAEFAWAVDSQELFIGNGSVAEGAPYVGNTKVLTEHDNILDLISSYQFASNDTAISLSIPRGLQTKLDEYVSVLDFGAVGDGVTDNVTAFVTAFTELFRNSNTDYRKILIVPNGEYVFSSDLTIPSGVILQGESQSNTILNFGASNIRFITSTGLELVNFSSGDETARPQNVNISNLTIQRTTGQTALTGLASSVFDKVKFLGTYDINTDTVTSLAAEPAAVFWNNDIEGIIATDIKFKSCRFENVSVGVTCRQSVTFGSSLLFQDTTFFNNNTSIYISGVAGQGNKWRILDCDFEEIYASAFRSTNGQGTLLQRSRFTRVGSGTGLASEPQVPMVYFEEKTNNLVLDCSSDRQQAISPASAAVTEVFNGDKVTFVDRTNFPIYISDAARPLSVFSSFNKYLMINYSLSLGVFTRIGQLTITIGDDRSEVAITDNFQYSSSTDTSEGGTIMTAFEFSAALASPNGDSAVDTVVLSYQNPLPGLAGTISFDVAYGV